MKQLVNFWPLLSANVLTFLEQMTEYVNILLVFAVNIVAVIYQLQKIKKNGSNPCLNCNHIVSRDEKK